MTKLIFILCLEILLTATLHAQLTKAAIDSNLLPKTFPHYQEEYDFDSTTNKQAWLSQPHGLQVSFGSTNELYFRKEVPMSAKIAEQQVTGWKGERINLQILLWSIDTMRQVRLNPNELGNGKGNKIDQKNIKANLVRYVLSNYPYGARDAICGTSPYQDGYLMPDRFEAFERFDLPGKSARPVWISIDIPADIDSGTYKGTIDVVSEKSKQSLAISVRVQNKTLPPPSQWKHLLDLWQNPWAVAWDNNVEPWSDEHKMLLKKHLQLYADAGGKYITTYAVHSPWADNSYMIEGGMIEWIRQKNNSWKFDYRIFDEYVQLAMQCGITHHHLYADPLGRTVQD